MATLLAVRGNLLDVRRFIPQHPGEGIGGTDLADLQRRDATAEFDTSHFTEEPELWIKAAQRAGAAGGGPDPETGLRWLGRQLFALRGRLKRLPKWLHGFPVDTRGGPLDPRGCEAHLDALGKVFVY